MTPSQQISTLHVEVLQHVGDHLPLLLYLIFFLFTALCIYGAIDVALSAFSLYLSVHSNCEAFKKLLFLSEDYFGRPFSCCSFCLISNPDSLEKQAINLLQKCTYTCNSLPFLTERTTSDSKTTSIFIIFHTNYKYRGRL